MSDLQSILAVFPSEPLTGELSIVFQQGDPIGVAFSGSGQVSEWMRGQNNWLVTSKVGKCLTIAIINVERGLLMPMALTSQERIDRDLDYFRTWWSENKGSFTNARLFAVKPDFAVHAEPKARADLLLPEVEKLTNLQASVTDFHPWTGKKLEVVALYSNGSGNMPGVICNNQNVTPVTPPFEDNSAQVQEMWDLFQSSG